MKRLASLLLVLTIVATILAACPAPPAQIVEVEKPVTVVVEKPVEVEKVVTAPLEPVTIEWWTVTSNELTEEGQRAIVEAFEAKYPHIKVNLTLLPDSGFDEKMTTALGAGAGAPDVAFFWNNNWFPEALDLRPFIERDNFDVGMYFPGFWKTRALWGDVVVGLPQGVGCNFVMYNKDVFDEAGVPYPTEDWTTEDFTDLAVRLTDPAKKRWGGDRPRGPFRAIWFTFGPNARLYSDDSMTVEGYLNSPDTVAAYTWLWDLVQSGSTPTSAELEVLGTEGTGPVDLFLAGRLAMATLNQGHMIEAVKAGTNFGIVPEPRAPDGENYVNAWALTASVWKRSKYPYEAWTFLKFFVGPEGQQILMEKGNLFPSIPSALAKHKDSDKDYVQAFFRILDLKQVTEWRMSHLCESTVTRAVSDVWDRVNLGEIGRDEIQSALDELVPAAQAALDECRERLGS